MIGTDLAGMRRLDDQAVLSALWATGQPMSVTNLVRHPGLSRTTIETLLTSLVGGDLVESVSPAVLGVGRPARRYQFAARRGVLVGIDAGLNSLAGVPGDLRGTVLAQQIRVERSLTTASAAAAAIVELATALVAASGASLADVVALTVGVPGIVDANGAFVASTVVPQWVADDIGSVLARMLPNVAILFGNDTKLAALAEVERGTISAEETAILLRVGNRLSAVPSSRAELHPVRTVGQAKSARSAVSRGLKRGNGLLIEPEVKSAHCLIEQVPPMQMCRQL